MGINRLSEFWPEWEIEALLGEGSYGKVYKAVKRDRNFSSYSAIKVISVPSSTAEFEALRSEGMSEIESRNYLEGIVDDFANEIKLMETLKGAPHIVAVEDYKILEKQDRVGWDIYIRMELLESFKDYSSRTVIDEEEVLKLGTELATALEICREEHIIHRDIKPANIFVSRFKEYKMGDFGVAKELEKTTGAMSAKGTFSYMAPEVAHGLRYDATVDIYSLGIVMYTLLNNNRQPFIDPYTAQISYNDRKSANDRRLSGERLPAPCNATKELADIILCACDHDPNKRFRTPTEFKNALNYYKNNRNRQTPPSTPPTEKEIKLPDNNIFPRHKEVNSAEPENKAPVIKGKELPSNGDETMSARHINKVRSEPDSLNKLPDNNIKLSADKPSLYSEHAPKTAYDFSRLAPPYIPKEEKQKNEKSNTEIPKTLNVELSNNPTLIIEDETERNEEERTSEKGCLRIFVICFILIIGIFLIAYMIDSENDPSVSSNKDTSKLSVSDQYYSIDGSILTIKDFTNSYEWKVYNDTITNVVVSGEVEEIPASAFSSFNNLKRVTLPGSISSIGDNAFDGCSALTYIDIPDAVSSIGESAFRNCSSLTYIFIPDSVTSIESNTFYNCSSLASIYVPDNITHMGENAFYKCDSLSTITLSDNLSTIEKSVFFGCSALRSITIPESVTEIGNWAFGKCSSLETARILGAKAIGPWAFESCTSLEELHISDSVESIDERAFKINSTGEFMDNIKIFCPEDSYAHKFAEEHSIIHTITQ